MKNEFARNIQRYRKKLKLTQDQLATKLGISSQAVSKWENGQTFPDIELLPEIAQLFDINIDSLLGYKTQILATTEYEKKYQSKEYYWGNQVWSMCYDVLKLRPPIEPIRLLDIGCGEGQAAVFFQKNGYTVSAYDISASGLEKGKMLANLNGTEVNFFEANILNYNLENMYDIVYGSGVLQYLPGWRKEEFFRNIKEHTNNGGIHIFNVFVNKPFINTPPDWEVEEEFWETGELFHYYHDWKIHHISEEIFDCYSSGAEHQHCMDIIIAEKI